MTDRELMQQALEALTAYDGTNGESKRKRVLAALRERLAQPEQEPVNFKCTVIDDANPNGVPLSQWGKQHEMQPCAGRNCGSTNPNLHSAECFEDYEKSTGMNQRNPLTNDRVWLEYMQLWPFRPNEEPTLAKDILRFARAIEAAHGIKGDA